MKRRSLLLAVFIYFSCFSISAQNLDSLKTVLEGVFFKSMALRKELSTIASKHGYNSPEIDSLNTAIRKYDEVSLEQVITIIGEHGWLGKDAVGEVANKALFVTIQHAAKDSIRQNYFPLLEASANSGASDLSDMATMKDRILVESGKDQLYGTQSHMVGGELVKYPIHDPKNLKKRRRKVGLGKM